MGHHRLDNGEAFMRANRMLHQEAINQYNQMNPYNPWTLARAQATYQACAQAAARQQPWTPGEKAEPEDVTGLRLLEEFLQKRRDGNKGE